MHTHKKRPYQEHRITTVITWRALYDCTKQMNLQTYVHTCGIWQDMKNILPDIFKCLIIWSYLILFDRSLSNDSLHGSLERFLSCCSACRIRTVSCWKTYVPHYRIFRWNEIKTYIKLRKCVRPWPSDYLRDYFCRSLQMPDAFFYKLTSIFPNKAGELDSLDERLLPTAHCSSNEIALYTHYFMKVLAKRSTQISGGLDFC
jgi:hypothetical protein